MLLMTPNMSLEKWNDLGQLSRETWLYREICCKADLNLIIYSYGRNDTLLLKNFPNAIVLGMFPWIPKQLPYRLQNFVYNISSLFLYRQYFKKIKIIKTNQFSGAKFGLLLKLCYRTPLIIRMGFYNTHYKKMDLFKRLEEKFSFTMSDFILTTSSEAK